MVLLNGVKYACERCIRGHRVSSCIHTDKPLTMIKPKGRPASQCLHCREQRKQRSAHISCVCGKKGKSPGQHFASCLCHKNSSCTCSKEKKPRKKKADGEDVASADALDAPQMIIEDIAIPFEAELGLLDCFSPTSFSAHDKLPPNDPKYGAPSGPQISSLETPPSLPPSSLDPDKAELDSQPFPGLNSFANPPSDAELDMMEKIFPLFPLVGSSSFSENSSLPLSAIKPKVASKSEKQESPSRGGTNMVNTQNLGTSYSSNQPLNHTAQGLGRSASQSAQFNPYSTPAGSTHHPTPLRASASFDGTVPTNNLHGSMQNLHGNMQNLQGSNSNLNGSNVNLPQTIRPRRPESALSVTSSSSNTSKQNLFEQASYNLPKTSSSTAFPPFNVSQNNSNDDFSSLFNPGTGMFNESRSLSLVSDDDTFKNFHSTVTPQSSLPSRQTSQSRRKSSLTRSTQAHHTLPQSLHTVHGKERANSCDSSPYQASSRRSPSVDQQKLNRLDTYLREVAEESAPASLSSSVHPIGEPMHSFGPLSSAEQSRAALDIPMYSELLEYTPN